MAGNATASMECSHAACRGRLSKRRKKNNLSLEAPTCCASLPARRLSCQRTRPDQQRARMERCPLGFRRYSHFVSVHRGHISLQKIPTALFPRALTYFPCQWKWRWAAFHSPSPSCPVVLYEPTPPGGPQGVEKDGA
jgi:hypothetical protein